MTVLRAEAAALQAHAAKKRREAIPVTLVCLVISLAIVFIEYRVMLLALMVLAVAAVPFVEAVRARRLARRHTLVELDLSAAPMALRTESFAWPLAYDDVPQAVIHPDALVVVIKRGKKFERWAIPAEQLALEAIERELAARGVPVHREKFGPGAMVAILGGVVAFWVVSFAAGGMVLFGLLNIVLALGGREGSLLTGVGSIAGALVLLTGIAIAPRLAR